MYHHATSTSSNQSSTPNLSSSDIRLSVAPTPPLSSSPPASASAHAISMPSTSSTTNRHSHYHSRNGSLTSACLPSGAPVEGQKVKARGWKVFGGWAGEEAEREREKERERESVSSEGEGDNGRLNPRPRSSIPPSPRPPTALLLVSAMMGPFGGLVLSSYHQPQPASHFPYPDSKQAQPAGLHGLGIGGLASGASSPIHGPHAHLSPAAKRSRSPLLIRVVGAAYVLFALAFFSTRMVGWYADGRGDDALLARRSVDREGQQVIVSGVEGLGRTGWGDKWRDGLREGTERWSNSFGGFGKLRGGQKGKEAQEGEQEGWVETDRAAGEDEQGLRPALHLDADVSRTWAHQVDGSDPSTNPLSEISHEFRFSKMYSKVQWNAHDEIQPYFFPAESLDNAGLVTACMYSNDAWLSELPSFVNRWNGPVSLVFESAHSRNSHQRANLISVINRLRNSNRNIRNLVDFHLVSVPTTSQLTVNRTRERLITRPTANNFHLNLARTFARTEAVWMVGDARVFPSQGLRAALQTDEVRKRLLQAGDAIVVPTFGFLRTTAQTDETYTDADGDPYVGPRPAIPAIQDLRANLGLPPRGAGVNSKEFSRLASEYVAAHHRTLPLSMDRWPSSKADLVALATEPTSSSSSPSSPPSNANAPIIVGHDFSWDVNKGPTNFNLWQLESGDVRLEEPAVRGGGAGLGSENGVGGGAEMYRVAEYDMHYAPNVVMAKHGQPWCTERFEDNKAACVYQAYLTGAELWVLPGEWAWTTAEVEKVTVRMDPARKLEKSITNKMYTKYHQEACMQYGRQFLSMDMWDHPKAKHLRFMCDRILNSYGMGVAGSS